MRFHNALNVDVTKWKNVKLERENNNREVKLENDEELPKFGAGSEFGREQKEEARKKKYGRYGKKYNPDDQPWQLRVGGKAGKRLEILAFNHLKYFLKPACFVDFEAYEKVA